MENLKVLENKIRTALPRLMELKTGCVVISKATGRTIEIGKECFDISSDGVIIDEQAPSGSGNKYQVVQEIIGHNPQLTDVLDYLNKIDFDDKSLSQYDISINIRGNIWAFFFYGNGLSKYIGSWDLSKPLLKDQSEETIDSLLNIEKLQK